MGNYIDTVTAAILDDDHRRRARLTGDLELLGVAVAASAGHGLVGTRTVHELAPTIAFVAFEEPLARAVTTITHASVATRVVAYTSDPSVRTYQAAIRAGARLVLGSPPAPNDLATALERALPKKAPPAGAASGQVVVVASAKGGTGKSTIAANLAALLAREHASSVLLVDFALDFGDVSLLLDLPSGVSTARAARQVARADLEEFRESMGHHSSGVFVLSAAQRFSERVAVEPHELEALLALAAQSFDHIVIDTAAVFDDPLILAMSTADLALVAAAPDVVSIENTRRFLHGLEAEGLAGEHVLPVLNATALAPSVAASQAAEALGRPTIWEVPFDSHIARANQRGIQPAAAPARSPALRSMRALAGRIAQDPTRIERRSSVRPGRAGTDPALNERLRTFFAPIEAPVAQPLVDSAADLPAPIVYSTAPAAAVYHAIPCTLGARIQPANRVTAAPSSIPSTLRPCKVCLPVAA